LNKVYLRHIFIPGKDNIIIMKEKNTFLLILAVIFAVASFILLWNDFTNITWTVTYFLRIIIETVVLVYCLNYVGVLAPLMNGFKIKA